MTSLLFAPHGDDETLFAAYSCIRVRPHVVVCSQDADQAIRRIRNVETTHALSILGCSNNVWPIIAGDFNEDQARHFMETWNDPTHATPPEVVYAPLVRDDGHEEHNVIGRLALEVFGPKVIAYGTYGPRGYRQREGTEVVPTSQEIARKLKAVACYATQIENPATRPWFFELLDLREWIVVQ